MGRSFNNVGLAEKLELIAKYETRDENRVARRQARETFMERGAVYSGRLVVQSSDGSGVRK